MNRKYIILFFAVVLAAVFIWFFWPKSNSSQLQVDTSAVENKVSIKHFDDAFFGSDTIGFNQTLNQLKVNFQPFFLSNDDGNFWLIQRKSESQQQLYADRQTAIADYKQLDEVLEDAFAHYYYHYPNQDPITVYTYISNLDFDYPIIVADGLVFIAVDLYLGQDHPAYAPLADYLRFNRQKAFIATDVMEALAFQYAAKDQQDNSLINDMIWWGKVLYFIEAMQPEAPNNIIIKYAQEHISFCQQNEAQIWSYFIDNQLLFDMSDDVKRKFIQPAPYSKFGMPFDNETPGMIGRWLGWQIVRSYMQANTNVSLPELMQDRNNREIFGNSKYKP
jgi:hypothetical protein